MAPDLTATDALLACAAATSRAELHAARLALIGAGAGVNADLDQTTLTAGDGAAGRHLLAATGRPNGDSCGIRSRRLQVRLFADLAREVTR